MIFSLRPEGIGEYTRKSGITCRGRRARWAGSDVPLGRAHLIPLASTGSAVICRRSANLQVRLRASSIDTPVGRRFL
jgi:hypothetical protein